MSRVDPTQETRCPTTDPSVLGNVKRPEWTCRLSSSPLPNRHTHGVYHAAGATVTILGQGVTGRGRVYGFWSHDYLAPSRTWTSVSGFRSLVFPGTVSGSVGRGTMCPVRVRLLSPQTSYVSLRNRDSTDRDSVKESCGGGPSGRTR